MPSSTAATTPGRMRAAPIGRFGAAQDVFEVVNDAPMPVPGDGEVLVRQRATSVNPIDCRRRAGYGHKLLRLRGVSGFPLVLGNDVSGDVAAVGPGVSGLRVGDAVFGAKEPSTRGAYAEYCAVRAEDVVHKPDALSYAQAAALLYAFLSAWAALGDAGLGARNAAGKRIFLQGGSGGTGVVTLQVCKALGAYVATTAGPAGVDLCRSLGADEVINYRTQDFGRILSGFDAAVCLADDAEEDKMLSILRPGPGSGYGTLVHPLMRLVDEKGLVRGGLRAAATLHSRRLAQARNRRSYGWSLFKPDRPALEMLAALAAEGKVRAVIDRTYPLEDIAAAHAYVERGRSKGKVVVAIG
ncbi:zinc-binding dehydrogenase [Streptomyces sp. ISL-43]|uniref:zinc-binding dehydrogenase n=1 Tax=Streptomyces sp. ISL-43 TaxID=2819183 RepID=UPI001BE94AAE|nr:zinc-binding dehydrogenase [Streptomyces sp. ISL-43]MBT2452812.1 zinc-binding dehydrogenase [Streptomyces sp. ISL-43]